MAPAKALPPSKAKTPAEKWKAWLASEYNDEQKFKANLALLRALGLFSASAFVIINFGDAFSV
ncbi:hypothetical protein COCSUDRAFT_53482 [Coccomyxa subellipsoidea C-169]|uniref:Uncharacterized protein n=1 Tax=Coccomyxa subellipsoidea (strain C-169) TaxID=574566 RepID=I0YX88_COCSC|nr:hypothetical protein COCSUDRAFT_53482 [Coccomyxa subellipsoidea C-169]EIE23007.1 hypothetical protein COCSUDRAFT_53482 [Coccomyxa subellipsoidea C-169]|eukprot:XP_005647551.1 hypothetical protein COCSUDRAFT_53482 [Coccomyxa subellipsoidea C-169]